MDAKFTELVEQLNGLDFKGMYGSDFLHTWDKTTDELKALYIVADALRELRENNVSSKIFDSGLAVSLFRDNSTRTRFSFSKAANLLGLELQDLDEKKSQIAHGETVRETATMISFMADVIGIRDDMYIGKGDAYMAEVSESVQQAYESGCHASFMPKPLAGEDGSAMFLCQSLFDHDGNNVFWGEDDEKYHLSDIAKHYMAGILAHAREISAITNPTVNSYKRITTGGDSVPLRKRLIRLPSSRRRFLFRNCIWCNPYSSGSQLPRPGGGVILRSTHSHHERRNKFQKCQISSPVTDASKNQGR